MRGFTLTAGRYVILRTSSLAVNAKMTLHGWFPCGWPQSPCTFRICSQEDAILGQWIWLLSDWRAFFVSSPSNVAVVSGDGCIDSSGIRNAATVHRTCCYRIRNGWRYQFVHGTSLSNTVGGEYWLMSWRKDKKKMILVWKVRKNIEILTFSIHRHV